MTIEQDTETLSNAQMHSTTSLRAIHGGAEVVPVHKNGRGLNSLSAQLCPPWAMKLVLIMTTSSTYVSMLTLSSEEANPLLISTGCREIAVEPINTRRDTAQLWVR